MELTLGFLEGMRAVLGFCAFLAAIAVVLGVYLERPSADDHSHTVGWRVLIIALIVEAGLAFCAWANETQISILQAKLAAPRVIPADLQSTMVMKLKPFAGQSFVVFAYWGTKETAVLANDLVNTFHKAGWVQYVPQGRSLELLAGISDVNVSANRHASISTQQAADRLVSVLNDANIGAQRKFADDTIPDNAIMVSVGNKQ